MKQVKIFFIALLPLLYVISFISCEEEILHKGKRPLVSVGKEFLYYEDVQRFYAAHPNKEDSVQYVENFINRWLEEAVFYNVALRNVPSSHQIDELVERYRRSLVLNLYQEGLVGQRLKQEISEDEVVAFYKANEAMYEAEEPMMKGLLVKADKKAQKISSLRNWCKERTDENLEKLDKYSLVNNVQYDYFGDSWVRVADIAEKTPLAADDLLQRLSRSANIEFKDDKDIYFISADSILLKGQLKPLELVDAEIRELLINTLKAGFIKQQKKILYDEAVNRGAIHYYNK